jgi:DNA-binding transcriptional MerR regulator
MTKETIDQEIKIPFSAAIEAAGISQMRLRHWLQRGQLRHLDAVRDQPDPGKHRRFSRLDIVRLALVARLVSLGYSADRASELTERTLKDAVRRKHQEYSSDVLLSDDLTKGQFREIMRRLESEPVLYALPNVTESMVLDSLRDAVMTIYIDERTWGADESDDDRLRYSSLYVYDKGKKDPGEQRGDSDTRTVIDVWRIMTALKDKGLV